MAHIIIIKKKSSNFFGKLLCGQLLKSKDLAWTTKKPQKSLMPWEDSFTHHHHHLLVYNSNKDLWNSGAGFLTPYGSLTGLRNYYSGNSSWTFILNLDICSVPPYICPLVTHYSTPTMYINTKEYKNSCTGWGWRLI